MRRFLLISVCSIVLFGTAVEAMRFEEPAIFSTGMKKRTKFLSVHNEALDKALDVHNLMTEIPGLKVVFEQKKKMQKTAKAMEEYQGVLQKCNEMRFGRFKNPKDVLAKVRQAYQKETQNLQSNVDQDENSIIPTSIAAKSQQYLRKKEIEKRLISDALTNGKKWGGEAVSKKQAALPETLDKDVYGTGLEELAMVEEGVMNAKVAMSDYAKSVATMQQDFVNKLAAFGISIPEFDGAKDTDMRRAHDELKKKKQEYIDAAKAYISKLDEQDAKYPELVARRESRSKNKEVVMSNVQDQFPDEFSSGQFDQTTPQDRQRMLIAALEKDAEGTVYLTETSALEIDQKMAEMKSTENLIKTFQMKGDEVIEMQSDIKDFDFSQCSG